MDKLEQQQVVIVAKICLEQLNHLSHHFWLTTAAHRESMFMIGVKSLEDCLHFEKVAMKVFLRIAKTTNTKVFVLHPL